MFSKCSEKVNVMESADARKSALTEWLYSTCNLKGFKLTSLAGDASFRRYFRLHFDNHSFIAMDAPPPKENCRPFVSIANALSHIGLSTPSVAQHDVERGFLLLSDFGDATYLSILRSDNASELYTNALNALAILSQCQYVPDHVIPPFTADFMYKEWEWYKEWFLDKWLGMNLQNEAHALDDCYKLIVQSAVQQPQVFMHRDFHSANLMHLSEEADVKRVGILDFQDAFIGPLTYDLASLLRDCYIAWPDDNVRSWALYYREILSQQNRLNIDEQTFLRWFDWMSVQRHLKALMTFARKQVRDQQPNYLQHIPRTLNYLLMVSERYVELKPLHDFLLLRVLPKVQQVMSCEQ